MCVMAAGTDPDIAELAYAVPRVSLQNSPSFASPANSNFVPEAQPAFRRFRSWERIAVAPGRTRGCARLGSPTFSRKPAKSRLDTPERESQHVTVGGRTTRARACGTALGSQVLSPTEYHRTRSLSSPKKGARHENKIKDCRDCINSESGRT